MLFDWLVVDQACMPRPPTARSCAACSTEGVRWLHRRGTDLALADKSAITKARTRLGWAHTAQG
jgi:hypothetical protein